MIVRPIENSPDRKERSAENRNIPEEEGTAVKLHGELYQAGVKCRVEDE